MKNNNILNGLKSLKVVEIATQYIERKNKNKTILMERETNFGLTAIVLSGIIPFILLVNHLINDGIFFMLSMSFPVIAMILSHMLFVRLYKKNIFKGLNEVVSALSEKQNQHNLLNVLNSIEHEGLKENVRELVMLLRKEKYPESIEALYNIVNGLKDTINNQEYISQQEEKTKEENEENNKFLSYLGIESEKNLEREKQINATQYIKKML